MRSCQLDNDSYEMIVQNIETGKRRHYFTTVWNFIRHIYLINLEKVIIRDYVYKMCRLLETYHFNKCIQPEL